MIRKVVPKVVVNLKIKTIVRTRIMRVGSDISKVSLKIRFACHVREIAKF
jgi:hypothetical protein